MDQSSRTNSWLNQNSGGKADELQQRLAHEHVALILSTEVARHAQAQLLFSFAVNLISRLFPVVQRLSVVVPVDADLIARVPRWRAASISDHVRTFLSALAPPLSWDILTQVPPTATISLSVGGSINSQEAGQTVFVGSSGWNASFSPTCAEPVHGDPNPIGAYAAACIGAAEIWKRALMPHKTLFPTVPIVPRTERLSFSTLTYRQDGEEYVPLPRRIDVGKLTMTGVGAGGGAALFTLASLELLTAEFCLIDPDPVSTPNLNRYVFADSADATRDKTIVAKQMFTLSDDLHIDPIPEAFATASSKLDPSMFRQMIAAVHSREARREIQMETPMVLWDCGAAEHGEFRVWRMILGQTECMYCKHPKGDTDPEEMKAKQLQTLFGLSPAIWLQKIKDHALFTTDDVVAITRHVATSPQIIALPVVGQRFDDWAAAQCGKLDLPGIEESVPIPFAPVMAGVLLAGEVVKEHVCPAYCLDSSYENTLLGAFSSFRRPERRLPRQDCTFCRDETYLKQYRRRGGA